MHPVTRRLIDSTPPRLRPAAILTFHTIDDSIDDRVPGLAAEIAFYALLSILPLLLTVLGTIGFVADAIGGTFAIETVDRISDLLRNVFQPGTVDQTIRPILTELLQQGRGDVATFGFLLTMFSASRAMRVIATGITIAYDLEATRPAWHQRLWGLGMTLAGIFVSLLLVPVLVVGPGFGEVIAEHLPVDAGVTALWSLLYWPVAGLLAVALVATLYHLVAPWWTPWWRDLPGAALAVLLFLAGTVGLRAYATFSFSEGSIYGRFGTPLVVLLWFWVSAMCLLVGAELNAEIERLWPTTTARAEHEGLDVRELQQREASLWQRSRKSVARWRRRREDGSTEDVQPDEREDAGP